ncbi:tyrosine--tRNA ligase [Alloiococcus sp. CFN-8]|uniref:tyrosine--tRNA ligase n=1 Tax=Alloiococcus sp. CFN-8 TaxID=3416081 RepID=UPI003CEC7754
MLSVEEQFKIIAKGAEEIISAEDLKRKLKKSIKENKPLRVKLGLDPSAPDIHLGHAVVLRKIKQLQDLGHQCTIIIGDFTGMIGDPTGKAKGRKQLSAEEVMINAKTYQEQIFKILDKEKTEVRFNSQWLAKLSFKDIIELTSRYTVARMLEREDFKRRFEGGVAIGIHEFFYPLMQAYDSLEIEADIELGGTDQRFNILMGRTLQKDCGKEAQIALFMPLLEGLDGKGKMSKSLGNYVGVMEEGDSIFGKVMSLPDELIIKYFNLATDIHPDQVERIKERLLKGENPRNIKEELAIEITTLYCGKEEALRAKDNFNKIFQKKELPEEMEKFKLTAGMQLSEIIRAVGFAESKSEAKRLIAQGAVKIEGIKVLQDEVISKGEKVLQVGKRKFGRIIFQ